MREAPGSRSPDRRSSVASPCGLRMDGGGTTEEGESQRLDEPPPEPEPESGPVATPQPDTKKSAAKKPEDLEPEQPDSPASRARRLLGLDPSQPEPEASVGDGKGVLVRGHSDLRGVITRPISSAADLLDRDAVLGRLCTEALPGWAGVDPSRCKVQDVSGGGGSQTYKISAHGRGVEPRTVALHSRSGAASGGSDRDPLNDVITEAAAVVFSKAGLSPSRLAYGKDWFLDLWEGTGWPDHDAEELPAQLGKQLAAVHAIPTEWFDGWREKLKESFPFLKPVPDGSHVWWFAHRSQDFLAYRTDEWKEAYCATSLYEPRTAAGRRIVTVHGDVHRQNLVRIDLARINHLDLAVSSSNKGRQPATWTVKFVDLEFASVSFAVQDLSYAICTCGGSEHGLWRRDNDKHREFLRAYLVASGQPADDDGVEELLADCFAYGPVHHFGRLAPWKLPWKDVPIMKQALADAVDSAEKRKAIVEAQSVDKPVEAAQQKLKRERIQKAMHGSRWYKAQQAAASGSALEVIAEEVASVAGQTITIKPAKDDGKALEVLAGTDRLCLGDYNPLDKNQQWIAKENYQLQHVATGLFLDSEVKYLHLQLGQPWESCGSALRVKPADADSGRQLWTVPRGSGGGMIQHIFDGRVLDINHHEVKSGSGVNVNVPHSFRQSDGFTWSSHEVDTGEATAADAGDGAPIGMEFSADTDISHIGGPIDPEFADGSSFLMTVAADQRFCIAVAAPPKCARPGCNFLRHSSQGHDYCCNACRAGQDHGPACERNACDAGGTPCRVYCQKVKADVDPKQCWRLVDGDRIQNVETGDFLSTETKYAFVANVDAPWEGNGTDLVTRARDDGRLTSNSQRWVFTAENGLPSTSGDGSPLHIEVRGAGAGWTSEGPWTLAADRHDGRPVWRRKANPDNDTISWFQEEGKWKLCGTSEVCFYEADSDTPLPPKEGWVSKGQIDVYDVDAGAAPTLHYSLDGQPVTDGRVLRHRLDGRAVDIHGWRFFDGAKMGVENSAHSDLKGVSYKFISPPLAVAAASTGDSGTKNEGWFVTCDGDFHGGDSGQEECANVAAADAMVLQKPAASSVAYQFYAPRKTLFTKPAGHNGEGEWRQQNPSDANLYLYGKDTGHRAGGKTLVAVQDVDLCFGDGQIENRVASYDEALARAAAWERTDSAVFWHTPSQRLIEKPKGNGCKWDQCDGVLFVWMDRFVGPRSQGKSDSEKSAGTVATPALDGEWYTVERSSGERNGDKYQFRGEKGHYTILPRGRLSRAFIRVFGDHDAFSLEGTTIKLGGQGTAAAEVQQNGEIFWRRDGGKWASRREGSDHEASANGAWTLVREDSTDHDLGSSVFVTLPVMACGADAKADLREGLSFHDLVQTDSELEGRWSHPQHGSGELHGSVENGKLRLHFPVDGSSYVFCRSQN